ncbi:MAG TPA: mucoidy inhibitor MuiA family protein [Allocoleopsis sp.]
MQNTVDTRICEVTVYADRALVTRRGIVQLTGEQQDVTIAPLPVTLLSESVRARSTGTVPVRLLGVRTQRWHTTPVSNLEVARLTQEIESLEERKRQGQDLLALLHLQRNFVKSLSNQYLERLTKFQNPEPLDLTQIRELMEFVGQQYSEFSTAIASVDKEQKQLDKQLQALIEQLQQLSTPHSSESVSIIVTLEPSAAGEFELEVSYIVTPASWVPLYDLRLSTTNQHINVSYLAEVKQNSGEDWLGVALTLSTCQPGLGVGTLPPKLTPWYINAQRPSYPGLTRSHTSQAPTLASGSLFATMPYPGMTPVPDAARELELELLNTAQVDTTQVSPPGGSVTFAVRSATTIESNGVPHKTIVFNEDYPCRAEYIAIPRLVSSAYLQSAIANPLTGITLLPGKANIFRDNTFVGTIELENIAPGQEFTLNLGIDEGVKIERDLVERQVDNKLIGNQCRTTYGYRLIITNLREQQVELKLTEQLPVSRNEQIIVRLTSSSPQVQSSELGTLEWSFTLPPRTQHEVYYQFTVEHPPELTVVGLDI